MIKRNTLRVLTLVGILLISYFCNAQNSLNNSFENLLEDLSTSDIEEESRNWENELQELTELINNPVNLNTATREQLEQFPFLNDQQIENILAYIYIHGQMQSIYELQLVEEMNQQAIEILLPFVCVKPVDNVKKAFTLRQLSKYGKHEIITRFDVPFYTRKGYEKTYLGPSVYNSVRYGFHYSDKLYAGVTAEKDAGEPLGALHNKKGYDFYSCHLLIKDVGRLKTLAAGNYRLNFGQGLVLGNGSMFGKIADFSSFTFRETGIRKHSSTDEYNYFRGGATTVKLNDWEISAFYSHRLLDGVIKENEITSIYKTGLHRSQKEADKMNLFTTQLTGGNVTYQGKRFKMGATGVYYFFDRPYEPELKGYSKYNLHGNHFYNLGMNYKYRWHRLSVQGEAAIGKSGQAFVNQVQYSFSQSYQLMLIHRYYTHDYWAMFAGSFSESGVQNENGWYVAASTIPFKDWKFSASLDLFSFPWWKYRISKPSWGMDGLVQAEYTPVQNINMLVNYRYKRKERDVTGTKGEVTLPTSHHRLRYRLSYLPLPLLLLRTSVDYNRFSQQEKEASQGYQLTQMISWQLPWLPLKAELQGSYFHTDNYDSRVYIYEKGMLYSFYTPSFQGEGVRLAVHLRSDIGKYWMLIAKFGETAYFDRDEIGSGNDLIRGNKKADVQMQLRLKF